jgi:hypothetical protein
VVPKQKSKPKLTDAQRHKRFVEMAREVEASESPKAFDRVFKVVISAPLSRAGKKVRKDRA